MQCVMTHRVKVVLAYATALDKSTTIVSSFYANMGGTQRGIIRLPPGHPVIQETPFFSMTLTLANTAPKQTRHPWREGIKMTHTIFCDIEYVSSPM